MKLFARYNRINLVATVVVFLLSGLAYFILLRFILVNQVDEDLGIEQREITSYVNIHKSLPDVMVVKDQRIEYVKVNEDGGKRKFTQIKLQEDSKSEAEIFRQLKFFINVNGQWYQISVSKSMEGTDDLIRTIAGVTLLTILLILVISIVINRFVLRRLWHPFYSSLGIMRQFELGKKEPLVFPATNIDEFKLMNETLQQTTAKAEQDYIHLKEFTENASHELQTPLAIIQSKLDLLMQDEDLNHPQSNAIQGAYEAVQRLAKLNQGLLLLAKIENGQFNLASPVNFTEKIKHKTQQFEELLHNRNIALVQHCVPDLIVQINPLLADIILNNLFSNAIKHNINGGIIRIEANHDSIRFINSGGLGSLNTNRLFQRFSKGSSAADGPGLGLAILKQAIIVSGLSIEYRYMDDLHAFELVLPTHNSGRHQRAGLP